MLIFHCGRDKAFRVWTGSGGIGGLSVNGWTFGLGVGRALALGWMTRIR